MGSYTLIDTALMPWEPMPGIPGFKRRLLNLDAVSGASVEMQYAPPGFSPSVLTRLEKGAVRHFHRTVTERHYFLAGDLPNCDWNDLDDATGMLTTYRRHGFLDRPPLTLHGLLPGHVPAAGSEYLVWNTGGGTALWEPCATRETVELDDGDGEQWRALRFTQPRIVQADRLASLPHPSLPRWQRMLLAPPVGAARAGTAEVAVVILPAGAGANGHATARNTSSDDTAWLFVVSGDLMMTARTAGSREPLHLYEGGFLKLERSRDGSVRADSVASDRGCTLLTVGLDFAPSH